MFLKCKLTLILIFISCSIKAQVIADDPVLVDEQVPLLIPDSTIIKNFCDSVAALYNQKVVCGSINSIYHEPVVNTPILGIFNNDSILSFTNNYGLFCIPVWNKSIMDISIRINSAEYYKFDTLISIADSDKPLSIIIKPRYKLLVRGRIITGTMPVENVDVEIVHLTDTFRTKTSGCYTDKENYWNCLYLGMFKQPVLFDNPEDSIFIRISKNGYNESKLAMKCSNYDGSILPIHLKFSDFLPELLQHNITLKLAFPFFDHWNAGINYSYTLNINDFNRIGVGFEGMMHISKYSTQHPTFQDVTKLPDTTYQMATFDTSYISWFIGPQIFFWFSNPTKRNFAFYGGLSVPFSIPQNKVYFHPFIGSRFFLDYNKAFIIEFKYLTYDMDVLQYHFNPYGKATNNTINKTFNKFLINFGLQLCF